uniref:Transmembrane protein n=1 Tax=Panagrolaimus sp. ES5 TaxID=591445 RepID=A0AC34GYG5_9BILA
MEFRVGGDPSDEEEEEFTFLEFKSGFGSTPNLTSIVVIDESDPSEDGVAIFDPAPNFNLTPKKKTAAKISYFDIIFYMFLAIFGLLHLVLGMFVFLQ